LNPSVTNALAGVRRWWTTGAYAPKASAVAWFPDGDGIGEVDSTYSAGEQNQARPLLEHGVDTGNFDVLFVPVTSKGFVGAFDVNGDGVSLISRCMDSNGQLVESSQSARLYIRVNSERAIGLPFSYLMDQNGSQNAICFRSRRAFSGCGFMSIFRLRTQIFRW
jgi:hypothetical protein